MTSEAEALLHDYIKAVYDRATAAGLSDKPPQRLMNCTAAVINQLFPDAHNAQLMANLTWLVIAVDYPSCAGWIMEYLPKGAVDKIDPLAKAINEVYLEVR